MTSMIAFGGLSWALDGAAAPVAAVLRLEDAMEVAGGLGSGSERLPARSEPPHADQADGECGDSGSGMPGDEIRFRNVTLCLSRDERARCSRDST